MSEKLISELKREIKDSWLVAPAMETALNWARGIRLKISKLNFPFLRHETESASYAVRTKLSTIVKIF